MKKNKGFTLVELLAVIVILAIIMVITIPSVLDVLSSARKRAFVQYVDKVVGLSQKKYLEAATLGQSSTICYIYNIESDLGLDNTGDFKGFVLVAPTDDSNYQYWVLLYDDNFFLDAIEYSDFHTDALAKLSNLPDKTDDLDLNYFTETLKDKGIGCSSFKYAGGSVDIGDNEPGSNEGKNCDGQTTYNTVPRSATGLYKLIAEKSYMDNVSSKYVSYCSGIDHKYNDGHGTTWVGPNQYEDTYNGTGIYELSSTKGDKYPIYYFRGDMNEYASKEGTANNVVFAGSCWKIIRTTSTGGIKMIYNGPYSSGSCGTSNLGYVEYNPNSNGGLGDASYMYGKRYTYGSKAASIVDALFGDTVTYSNGKYTLAGEKVQYNSTTAESLADISGKQYTCFNETGECNNVYYVYMQSLGSFYYITLSGGEKISDALYNSFDINSIDSSAKTKVDNWYENNLVSYQSYIEDTPYCNDRRYNSDNSFNEKSNIFKDYNRISNLTFAAYDRGHRTGIVSLDCERNDAFTVSNSIGNGALKYPVGLVTYDEIVLAGGSTGWEDYGDVESGGHAESGYNSKFYLHDDRTTWSMSPAYYGIACSIFSGCYRDVHSQVFGISDYTYETYYSAYIKPVISLKAGVDATGTGTTSDPYIIK